MREDPYKEYFQETEPDKRYREYAWRTAIGLQAEDGLETSDYLWEVAQRNISGEVSMAQAKAAVRRDL